MSTISKTVGITMGDPAGVGPEIIAKALAEMPIEQRRLARVYGDIDMMRAAAGFVGADLRFSEERNPTDGSISVDHSPTAGGPIEIGKLDPRAGDACFRYIASAVKSSLSNEIGCIVTAPINKEALNSAGHHYDGHTGMLAALTGSRASFMLLADTRMSVIHVSTHVSLKDAIGRATTARVLETIRAGYNHFRRIGVDNPRIAVAGINPHCGEHGLFGTEDEDNIAPAVALAQAEGINAMGPISPDTVFYRCFSGVFDLVVAQYHDQGHIPMKLVGFDTTVNVSLGLPIDRTSVDHGTAFDIAGTGKANHVNMNAAIAYARKLAGTPRIIAKEAVQ